MVRIVHRPNLLTLSLSLYLILSTLQAFSLFNQADPQNAPVDQQSLVNQAKQLFTDSESLYDRALEIEPTCVEALAQSAQLKVLLGKFDEAVTMINKALPLSRSRDEVQELGQMLGQAMSQVDAQRNLTAQGLL